MGPGDLNQALCGLHISPDPNVLAGIQGSEDAGVYQISSSLALVQTVDFFTPIVDDPTVFGRAAAANSLSDVYAMGGRPITAMNVVCFPTRKLGLDILRDILKGGLDILQEAGVSLIGGHSVEDDEPKYGLSVTGLIDPKHIMANSGLRQGDAIILTKPLGTGILATALKGGMASDESISEMVKCMCTLNKSASEIAVTYNVKACTDVTGFGLGGHLVEMARGSGVRVKIQTEKLPVLQGAMEAASFGFIPGGAHANRRYFSHWTTVEETVSQEQLDLVFDPQTSGGLLIGIPENYANEIIQSLMSEGLEHSVRIGTVTDNYPEGNLEIA